MILVVRNGPTKRVALDATDPHPRSDIEVARKVARIWEEQIGDAREAADAWRRVLRMKSGDKEATEGLDRAKSGKLKQFQKQLGTVDKSDRRAAGMSFKSPNHLASSVPHGNNGAAATSSLSASSSG